MKISEILQSGRFSFSCDIFPPKTGTDIDHVDEVIDGIAALSPSFISVTYGASGSTSKTTASICEKVMARGMTPIAHMTCLSSTRDEVHTYTEKLTALGVENVFALRGDRPAGVTEPGPGQYRYASQLVTELAALDRFCIGGACYPDGHVEAHDKAEDIAHLKEKVDAGCSFLTTQMFFDNDVMYSFLYRAVKAGIHVPILAGIMPLTTASQYARSAQLSGTPLPPRLRSIYDKFKDRPRALREAGIAYATEQIIDLVANGVQGIHIYTMNRPENAADIFKNIAYIRKTKI